MNVEGLVGLEDIVGLVDMVGWEDMVAVIFYANLEDRKKDRRH